MQKKLSQRLLWLCLVAAFCWPMKNAAATERPRRPLVIAALVYTTNNLSNYEGFKSGMKELGYVEGEVVTYLFNGPIETISELEPALAKLMAQQPDLIFASPTPAALAAQKATQKNKTPVVFGPVNDPVVAGLLEDQRHPGGNITGVMLSDTDGKRLQWISELAPEVKTVLLPYNPEDRSALLSLQKVREAAAELGLNIDARPVANNEEISALIAQCPDGIDAIFLPRDALVMARAKDFVDLALQKKAILSSTRSDLVDKGALFSYGFLGFEIGKQASRLADLILKGKNPGNLPVETAEDYLIINLKTAKSLGITIAPYILRQAHKIIRPQ